MLTDDVKRAVQVPKKGISELTRVKRQLTVAIARAEKAEALLREAIEWNWLDDDAPQQAGVNEAIPSRMDALYLSITAHLQEQEKERG